MSLVAPFWNTIYISVQSALHFTLTAPVRHNHQLNGTVNKISRPKNFSRHHIYTDIFLQWFDASGLESEKALNL